MLCFEICPVNGVCIWEVIRGDVENLWVEMVENIMGETGEEQGSILPILFSLPLSFSFSGIFSKYLQFAFFEMMIFVLLYGGQTATLPLIMAKSLVSESCPFAFCETDVEENESEFQGLALFWKSDPPLPYS